MTSVLRRLALRWTPVVLIVGRVARILEVLSWRYSVAQMRSRYDVSPEFLFVMGSRISGEGRITLGSGSYINAYANLRASAATTIAIGRGCRIGSNVRIYTSSIRPDCDLSIQPLAYETGDVTIEDWVWVGANVYIGPGVTIGDNAVVGANSVVTRDVEPFEIVAGAPLRHLRYKSCRPAG